MDQHRRDVWGDDPEEVEAAETVAEFQSDVEVQRAWHEHPAWVPLKVVWRFIRRSGKRVAVTIAGFTLVLLGIAGLALPIVPGWLLIIPGLALLATEYVWARRLLRFAQAKAVQAKDAVLRKKKPDEEPGGSPEEPAS
jgi:hypothetical protein